MARKVQKTQAQQWEEIERTLADMAAQAARDWFRDQCRNLYGAYRLYYKPSSGDTWGDILVAEDAPEGYQLAAPDRIRQGTIDQTKYWIAETLRRLPILPSTL